MKKSSLVLIFALWLGLATGSAQNSPPVEWQKSYWGQVHPPYDEGLYPYPANRKPLYPPSYSGVEQHKSGEDWFNNASISHDPTTGMPDGYICAGYTGFVNWVPDEWRKYTQCNPDFLELFRCFDLETAEYMKGSATISTVTKIDLDGNVVWSNPAIAGSEFRRVIQTADGGYLAVGYSFSREDWQGNPIVYNPNRVPGHTTDHLKDIFPCNPNRDELRYTIRNRRTTLCKFDFEGNVEWKYLYSMKPFDANNLIETFEQSPGNGFSLMELANGNFLLAGFNFDNFSPLRASIALIEVAPNGYWVQGRWVNPGNGESYIPYDLEQIEESGNTYYYIAGKNNIETGNPKTSGFVARLNANNFFGQLDFKYFLPTELDKACSITDLAVTTDNKLIVPVLQNCDECEASWHSKAEGVIYQLSPDLQTEISVSKIGNIQAYDMQIGATGTADGGFAIVTTKVSANKPANPPAGLCDSDPEGEYVWWNTDAYFARFNAAGKLVWDKTMDGPDPPPPGHRDTWNIPDLPLMRNVRQQECMYAVIQAPDGGFTLFGNHSSNYDDSYVIKIAPNCPAETDLYLNNLTITTSVTYVAANTITVENVTVVSPNGNLTLIAGQEVTLLPAFEARNFTARLDPTIDCVLPDYGWNGLRIANNNQLKTTTDSINKTDGCSTHRSRTPQTNPVPCGETVTLYFDQQGGSCQDLMINGGCYIYFNDSLLPKWTPTYNITRETCIYYVTEPGTYKFMGRTYEIVYDCDSVTSRPEAAAPQGFTLRPNPTTGSTTAHFATTQSGNVHLQLTDLQGRPLRTLLNTHLAAGNHTTNFDLTGLPAGLYLISLQTPTTTATQKLSLVR